MLRLIPRRWHRGAFRIAHALRILYWRIARPRLQGCSIIACDEQGWMLLVRPSYGRSLWQFPGGGVAAGEDPAAAARREFEEETGCRLEDLAGLGVLEEDLHGARNIVHVFSGTAVGPPQADRREIRSVGLFAPGELPEDISLTVARRLALLEQR